jgi:hypothetical protein
VDCFNEAIDCLVQELDNRFNETSSQLLVCSTAFNPRDSFHDFDVESLINLAKLYPDDFSSGDLRDLRRYLGLYIADVREDNRFSNINTISELSQKNGADKKRSLLSIGLSTFETCVGIANCYYNSGENIFGNEDCQDNSQ